MNLASNLLGTAARHPDRPAVRLGETVTTFRDLEESSARVAGHLRERGTKPGDRVAVMLPNVPAFAVVYYGVLRAGGVVVPMNPLLKAREVAYFLEDSGAGLIFVSNQVAREAHKGAEAAGADVVEVDPATFGQVVAGWPKHGVVTEREPSDTAVILYTSGTSGQPKGAELIILEGYGLSETSPVASFNHPDRERKPGTIGTPIRGVEMKVVDEKGDEVPRGEVGEIAIRGHNVMKGYWRRPEATAAAIPDGWFRTGDMGTVDDDGYFTIVDRKKDLIIRGGYNVYPREIEEVLYEHPAVAEAAVIGVPDPHLGEEVGAAVALNPGAQVTSEELRDFVKKQVAAYKYPRRVWLVDALPKGPTGKILKREIVPPAE